MFKRLFDIVFSLFFLILLIPLFVVIGILIFLDSKGPILYMQSRVGKNNFDFRLFKFRTMYIDSDSKGLITIGGRDSRITKVGYYLRKYKLDELPQLFNVLLGNMSFVGPRPEVRKYVEMYTEQQRKVLEIKPGITDYASIEYINENDILGNSVNPEETYINIIMPSKLNLNLRYIKEKNRFKDIIIIYNTFVKILKNW